ncbi:substrate-binding domain-containing protein [Agromyces binzhouensis]|uniref:substrate-binding domain-containing protein n=1 Tax=Agromyces binzhouensis TaxID=1817495 RepID=UPI00362517B9
MKIATTRIGVAAASLAIAATLLTACSNGSETGGGSSGGGGDALSIGLLLPETVVARYEEKDKPYFEAKIAELCPDCEVIYANADSDASKQQQQAESMLTQGVDVLVVDPYDGVAAASIAQSAAAQNVPVVSYDRLIQSDQVTYNISNDYEKVGQLQAQTLVDTLEADGVTPDQGGIVMLNGASTDNNAAAIKTGALSVIDASGFEVVAEISTWDPVEAQNFVAGQLTKGDPIVAVYSANDGNAGGAIAAYKAAGQPVVPMTGLDASLAGLQQIVAGDLFMTVYNSFRAEAEKAAEVAYALAKGETLDGDTTVDGIPSTLLEPTAVTVDNIEDTVIADDFYTVADICTDEYASACQAAGLE